MIEMLLTFEGVEGSERRKGVDGGIPVLAWSWGLSGDLDSHARLQDMSLTLWQDPATVGLANTMLGHKTGRATLHCFRPRDEEHALYRYELEGAAVTSLSMGGSGGEDRFTVNCCLSFRKLTMYVGVLDGDGNATGEYATATAESRRPRR